MGVYGEMKILYNAQVYTLDPQHPTGSAILVDGDRVRTVADDPASLLELEKGAEMLDVGGRAIIPGLTDAHIHLKHYATGLQKVDCETPTLAECLRRVAERASALPPEAWILGHGWNQNAWGGGFPTALDLDVSTPHQPVFLTHKSLHSAWVNSAALSLAGITAETLDPVDGIIGRDERGKPTGILFEAAAPLVASFIPEPPVEQIAQSIREAQPALWRMGLTGVHDFDRRDCFSALQILHECGELGLRVIKSIPLEELKDAVGVGLRTGFGDNFLRIGPVKAFADGALGPRTAAMFQPYEGESDALGMLMLDAEELFERGRLAVENGLSLAVHAIGDRANHEILNAYGQLRKVERSARIPLRHRIEHVQLLHPQDISRLAELGVIASMQPIHATSDMLMAERHWGTRSAFSYAWRTQLEQGAVLAFGSDAPVESPDPFWGIHAAVTRRRGDGSPGPDGWYPAQRLTVLEALRAFTYGAAYAAGMEDRLGRLAPRYLADLLVLDVNPFTCDPVQLRDIRPLATMVAGEWVWREI
jgi:predicted amidohydrolase YtcJ